MKIALISTPLITVPPPAYGGLEMIVWDLARALTKLGHKVVVFAPTGSKIPPNGFLVECGEPKNTVFIDWLRAEKEMWQKYDKALDDFDIIHSHDWFGMAYASKVRNPSLHVLHTHHGGLSTWWTTTKPPFKLNMCAISNWMKSVYEGQGIPSRAVYNGVDLTKYPLQRKKGDRYLWLSRIAFFKAPHKAIELARKTGIKLDVAGAELFVEDAKYVEEIKKSCDGEQIRFIGEVTHEKKLELLQNAKAMLVTGNWGEPFGLHVIEALSCGTTVISIADGGIAETLKGGGILCDDIDAMEDAIKHFQALPPTVCRRNAMMFSSKKMAESYAIAYRDIISGKEW